EEGKKPKDPRAIVIHDCMMGVADGQRLSAVLAKWTNYQETSLIAAGEKSGNLKKAFDDTIRVITAKRQILGAVLTATVYPVVLFSLACVLLNMVANQLVPKLAKTTNPETWEGAAALLYQ
uniref:type II secretion system F family protein n=2 Tax=Burkholderiales TaxID=80840 RepID=UPI002D79F5D0